MELTNKKVLRQYNILHRLTVGLVLVGTEVKSIRHGKASIQGAYVSLSDIPRIKNMQIFKPHSNKTFDRDVPILMRTNEIVRWRQIMQSKKCAAIVEKIDRYQHKLKATIVLAIFNKIDVNKQRAIEMKAKKHKSSHGEKYGIH